MAVLLLCIAVCLLWSQSVAGNFPTTATAINSTNESCENGGECVSALGCFCRAGYKGDRCEVGPECGDGWHLQGTQCYKYFEVNDTWRAAEATCSASFGHLVSINGSRDVDFFRDFVRNATSSVSSVWIGEWHGVSTNSSQSANVTASTNVTAPTNVTASNRNVSLSTKDIPEGQSCPVMSLANGSWFYDSCEKHRSFVCQRGLGCDALLPPRNGSITNATLAVSYGGTVLVSCVNRFSLKGSTFRSCQRDGVWSGKDSSCIESHTDQKVSFTGGTYVALSISLTGHVLTVIAYLTFDGWLASAPSKTVLISSLTISGTLVLFLANGNNRGNEDQCMATTTFLHFLWLFTAFWTAVEGVAIILKLRGTEPRGYPEKFVFRAVMVAFSVTAFIVLLSLGIEFDDTYYRPPEDDACGPIGLGLYYAILTPLVIFLFVDSVVFIIACIYLFLKINSSSLGQMASDGRLVAGGVLQTLLLGLTWIACAIFASNNEDFSFDTRTEMQDLFHVTAPLMGIQVFIFQCLLHSDASRACKQLLCCCSSTNSSVGTSKVVDASASLVITNSHGFSQIDSPVVESKRERLLSKSMTSEVDDSPDPVAVV